MPSIPRLTATLAAALFLTSPVVAQTASVSPRPATLSDGWRTGPADSAGLDPGRLAALTASVRAGNHPGIHAILIERGGRLVYEEYFSAPDTRWGTSLGTVAMNGNTLHDLRSVTKSVVSALVGIAVGDGAIKSLDQPVVEWFPEYPELNTAERRRITLAHVLGMTAGLEWNEEIPYTDPRNDEIRMTRDPQPLRFALSPAMLHSPGKEWEYSGGLVQVMAAVLERATKQSIEDYARTRLFAPLGIDTVEWVGDLAGMPAAASGLRLRARDLAKFGSVFLHGGKWNGKQVVPAAWVESSTRRQFPFSPQPTDSGGRRGYGHFWWYSCLPGEIEARTAVGNGQQRVYVVPKYDLVVTIFAGRYNDPTASTLAAGILRNHVLPAVRTGAHPGCPGA
jgi:CubicO group peptidase (beta-lactamase class C family)